MIIALIPVGESRRLPKKHFLKLGEKQVLEIIVDKLLNSKLFDEVALYSTTPIKIENTLLLIDENKEGPLKALIKALNIFDKNIFLLAGDMPFFEVEQIRKMLVYPEKLSIIPKWNSGYIEPLHALYSVSSTAYEIKKSFHEFIDQIPKLFLRAEDFPSYEFFNMNTFQEYEMAKKIYEKNAIKKHEI
ncbi:MAG: molybdenum cofactor guanylyltransferase [Thermoplasmata archaeon]